MILRAIFWIALVSVLMPHEPDLGFGRPQSGLSASRFGEFAKQLNASSSRACDSAGSACTAGANLLDSLQSVALRSMAEVKADIEDSRREHALGVTR